ncbi:DeoR/GlpR family DNA-binding transcription regulator [Dongia deserti]|uniref:DeoR/GlpR family DNA-binding transcription regulator n=1 Tax=Dongia deserti TaxID=2268030 RepID=UPI002548E3A3|nr:DeoR/GlpR family DNA-binding transcription regulator [Dongia deserti]
MKPIAELRDSRVLAEERQRLILSMVNDRGSISITEIQRKLNVSRETIRRDLVAMADSQLLRKTHGGALSLEQREPEMAVRQVTNIEAKRAIGRLAAGLVPDGASVILASGTTTQAVAEALMARRELTVFTNSVFICGKLMGRNGNRVYMLGGEIQPSNGATLGRDATEMLAHYFADFGFIGAGAISPAGWLMDYTREEGELHSRILMTARTAAVVADHGKFGRFAPIRVGNFERATHLITDVTPEPEITNALAHLPLEVLVADKDTA